MRETIDALARTPLSQVVLFVTVLTVIRIALHPVLVKTPRHKQGGGFGFARVANEMLDAFVYAGVFVFMLIRPFGVQAFLIPSGSMWPTLHVNDFIVANKAIYRYSDPRAGDIVVFRPPKDAALPDQLDAEGNVKVDFIKRCIGTPGQIVELKEGVLYRDGQRVDERYKTLSACLDDPNNCQNFRSLSDAEKDGLTKASFKLVKYRGEYIPLNYTQFDANSPSPSGGSYSVAERYRFDDPEDGRKLIDLPAEPIPQGYFLMMGDNRNGSYDSRGWGLVPRDSIIGRSEFIWLPIQRWQVTR